MVLSAHADAGYLNKTKSRSRAGTHIYISEENPIPQFNESVLTIAQIINFLMLLAEEYELVGLFVTSKEMVPIRQSIIKIGWLQPRLPVQTNKSTASGVTNNTIIPKQKK